jgi:hypothetical protein
MKQKILEDAVVYHHLKGAAIENDGDGGVTPLGNL